jgi:hypothetical protein
MHKVRKWKILIFLLALSITKPIIYATDDRHDLNICMSSIHPWGSLHISQKIKDLPEIGNGMWHESIKARIQSYLYVDLELNLTARTCNFQEFSTWSCQAFIQKFELKKIVWASVKWTSSKLDIEEGMIWDEGTFMTSQRLLQCPLA